MKNKDESGMVSLDRNFGCTGEGGANGVKNFLFVRARFMNMSNGRFISQNP
jgi:hypothetical protein